ncbi:MAG: PDZ domain-containing protein [Candidatus Caldatribacteriota bacterium]|nr:PDZ domain-containing protein [Candidatus Caldatribacteriota bacterium]
MIKKYLIIIIIAIVILSIVPTSYYLVIPGQCIDLSKHISVENGEKDAKGSFYLTSIALKKASLLLYLYSFIDPDIETKEINGTIPDNINQEEYKEIMDKLMQKSQMISKIIALRKAGYFSEITGKGVIVNKVLSKSPAKGKIKPGDLIVKVNEKPIRTVEDFSNSIYEYDVNSIIKISFIRNNKLFSTKVHMIDISSDNNKEDKLGIGIYVSTKEIDCKFPLDIQISIEEIKGSSAGLIMALEILNQLTENDLSNGLMIAGTGILNIDGSIKQVDGIKQKIILAKKNKADIFLVPADNYIETIKYSKNIKIIPVKNFDEAIMKLIKMQI